MDPNHPDAFMIDIFEKIGRYGWTLVGVYGDEQEPGPPFVYTVGLTALGHPELSIFGLPLETGAELLNLVAARVKNGLSLKPGDRIGQVFINEGTLGVIRMTDRTELRAAACLYGDQDVAFQLVWPDPEFRMPWEPGYSMAPEAQPLYGLCPLRDSTTTVCRPTDSPDRSGL